MLKRRGLRLRAYQRDDHSRIILMGYWISYRTQNLAGSADALEQNDTALGAYLRATALSEAGECKVKIRDADTYQSWGVEAFAASHGLIEPPSN